MTSRELAATTRSASDTELATILDEVAKLGTGWLFVEGPERSGVAQSGTAPDPAALASLWQVRLFGEDIEVAARRQDFQSERPWNVRYVSAQPPSGPEWSDLIPLKVIQRPELLLYGSLSEQDGRRQFSERRFGNASILEPPKAWRPGERAKVVVETLDAPGGAIVCWRAVEPHTPSDAKKVGGEP